MRRAIAVKGPAGWHVREEVGQVTLDWDHRHRRRLVLRLDGGGEVLLDLAHATVLREGDGLVLEGGGIVAVRADPEAVCDIRCDSPEELARIAWHLGNRHLPVEILPGVLRIRDDHVIVAMLEGMGARVTRVMAPFTPEGGAYNQHDHGTHHHHGDDHCH